MSSVEEQRQIISDYAQKKTFTVDSWYTDSAISEDFISRLSFGDTVVVSDLSKICKSYSQAIKYLSKMLKKNVRIISVEEDESFFGDQLGYAFDVVLKIEARLLSENTRAGMKKAKNNGRSFGRKTGQKMDKVKLSGKENEIKNAIKAGKSISFLSHEYDVSWITMKRFISEKL